MASSPSQNALYRVVEGGKVSAHEPTENELIDAVLTCLESEGILIPKSRISPAIRTHPKSPDHAARALGVPVRPVNLARDPLWWSAGSEALIVNYLGHWLAATPEGKKLSLHLASGEKLVVNAQIAAAIAPNAWALIPTLQDGPSSILGLLKLGWSNGSTKDVVLLALTGVVSLLIGMLIPIFSGTIIGELVPAGETRGILVLTAIMILVSVMALLTAASQNLVVQRLSGRFGIRITAAIYERIFRLPASFHRENVPGELSERIGGASAFQGAIASIIPSVISAFGALLGSLLVIGSLSPQLSLAVLGLAISSLLIGLSVLPRLAREARRKTEASIELTGLTFAMLLGISKIRTAGAENRMFSRWNYRFAKVNQASRDLSQANLALILIASLPTSIIPILLVLSEATGASSLSIGEFTTVTSAAAQGAAAIMGLLPLAMGLVVSWPAITAMRPILDAEPEPMGNAGGDPGQLTGRVEFNSISFEYSEEVPVLKDVSFLVPEGTMTAIVGASGSGKSTIVRLLLGLEAPLRGTVLFDGQALSGLDREAVLQQMGVVPQESALIPGSILENILASAPDASEEQAWLAAERADIAKEIREMPMGMRTVISDGASTFSGGQKQRLMIARALVKEPRILILDEATSALDNHTQASVAAAIAGLGSTRIVVAHRLSTIKMADQILVLDKGEIVETGNYETLMALGGKFNKLAARQLA